MSEERKKKSGAAWKAEEDEKLNKSRAFVELTEYRANAVDNFPIPCGVPYQECLPMTLTAYVIC